MTATNFKPSLTLTLAYEGGYVNHPKDPGGATNKGITQRVYDGWRRLHSLPPKPVSQIETGEVAAIYKQQYWQGIQGDRLPLGIDYAVFDFAVNSGVGRASRYLQLALGVSADGHIGVNTLAAAEAAEPQAIIERLCADRMAFFKSLATFDTFGKGWARRVIGAQSGAQADDTGVIDYAMNMAGANMSLAWPKVIGGRVGEPQTAKAVNEDFAFMPSNPMPYGKLKLERWAA